MRLPEYTVLLFFCAWHLVWCGLFPPSLFPRPERSFAIMPFAFSLALPLLVGVNARRRQWRCAKHQQRCSQHACRALIHDRSQCPTPLRAGLLSPRVVPPHPQGLQGSHLNLSQASAQRHRRYFLLNNKAVKLRGTPLHGASPRRHPCLLYGPFPANAHPPRARAL